ncbi:MAG: peptide chain release factor N(5)-glutamine methyltransferase [Flavobacteriales bacterium]|jgi:release factor glutamine methyltransferase|nr:peptide chain release factor N(5)-glutamine methyltransferase [Flavobacteriales bacterium]
MPGTYANRPIIIIGKELVTLKELQHTFQAELAALYPSEEVRSFFNLLTDAYFGMSPVEIVLNGTKELSEAEIKPFLAAIQRLKQYEPIQYIIGETEFYGALFSVNKHTLIPRPETEELVAWILSDCRTIQSDTSTLNTQDASISILDIGTGTGCIAITLASQLPNAEVTAIDVSEDTLKIASKNANQLAVSVNFVQEDILSATELPAKYDVIVSNPPYVRDLEKDAMSPNVLAHEPATALFVSNDDPLVFYRAIAKLAAKHLKPQGSLYFEINEYLSSEMEQLMKQEGFAEIVLKKDGFGKFRMLRCCL